MSYVKVTVDTILGLVLFFVLLPWICRMAACIEDGELVKK